MSRNFDMTQPETEAAAISSETRATGREWADARRNAEEAESLADFTAAAASKAARCGKVGIGEAATVQAVKDYVETDATVAKAREEARDARWLAHKAELAFKAAEGDREMFKGLLYASSRVDK